MLNAPIKIVTGLLLPLILLSVIGCGVSTPKDPKSTVIAVFGAMEKNDQAALAHLLDLGELMKNINSDYALQTDKPRLFTSPQQILEDLTNEGKTKTRWFSFQRIIANTEVSGESATVEVTFVDKAGSKGYMTRFGVHIVNGRWKVYSFKTIQEQ